MPFNSYPYFVFLAVAVIGFRLLEKQRPDGAARVPAAGLLRLLCLVAGRFPVASVRLDPGELRAGPGNRTAPRAQQNSRQRFLVAGLVFNLGLIATFKYDNLFVGTADQLLGLGLPIPHFFLPLAISFFTFEQISYLVDADAGKTPGYTLLDYALFVAYFPHLIAGPIVRHNDLIPQFRAARAARNDDLATGITLFTIGLAKKTLIADNLGAFRRRHLQRGGPRHPSGTDRRLARHAVLRLPDLFRFFRLFRHGAGFLGACWASACR